MFLRIKKYISFYYLKLIPLKFVKNLSPLMSSQSMHKKVEIFTNFQKYAFENSIALSKFQKEEIQNPDTSWN